MTILYKNYLLGTAAGVAFLLGASGPSAAEQPIKLAAAGEPAATTSGEEVVVMARRRAEALSRTPVAVQAFSSQKLVEANVKDTTDLQKLVPGVVLSGAGQPQNTTFTIRGQGRFVIGGVLPSVLSYINEVPLPAWGGVFPTFDLANIQVLKGPQGTLFGRNTVGGAILVYTEQPSYEFNGYLQGQYGNYNWGDVQGAINVPIIKNKLAVRVAADIARRDPYTEVIGPGRDGDDVHADSFRASVLFEPTDFIKNTTVYDYYHDDTGSTGNQPSGQITNPFVVSFLGIGPAIAQQHALGPRTVFSNVPGEQRSTVQGLSNTTVVELGNVTFKNIFGWRNNQIRNNNNTDGIAANVSQVLSWRSDRQITDEVQLSGSVFQERLEWLIGGFYLSNTMPGPTSLLFTSSIQNALFTDTSRAVFGNLIYKFSGALDGLRLSGGLRYTSDRQISCAFNASIATPPVRGFDACTQNSSIPFYSNLRAASNKLTWQIGLDYQINENIFVYVTGREGYRAGGLNTPNLGGNFMAYQIYAPQSVTDVEIGLKSSWQSNNWSGRFNIALFRGKFDKLQRAIAGLPADADQSGTIFDDPSNRSLYINAKGATVQGVELDGNISPFRDLTITYGGSYLDGSVEPFTLPANIASLAASAAYFENAPRWSYNVGFNYHLPFDSSAGEFYLNGVDYYVSPYYVGLTRLRAHSQTDFSLDWRHIGGKPLTASLFVQNAFNVEYPNGSILSGPLTGYVTVTYAPPRLYGFRLRWDFGSAE